MNKFVLVLFIAVAVLASSTFAAKINCDRPHEIFACGSACQTTCANLGQPCPIKNVRCNDACYCEDGYARNSKGMCIPISMCAGRRRRRPKREFLPEYILYRGVPIGSTTTPSNFTQ
ncbi:Inducible metalloproteinase inhibitor protein [Anthophora retusa]